jgi:hypothetical protein
MRRLAVVLGLALALWLMLTRLPLEGAAAYITSAIWGIVLGASLKRWTAGLALVIVAIVGDLLALVLGWFVYLGDSWFIPAVVAGVSGALGGMLSWFIATRVTSSGDLPLGRKSSSSS